MTTSPIPTTAEEIQAAMRAAIDRAKQDPSKSRQVFLDWESPTPGHPYFIVSVFARPIYQHHIKRGDFSEVYDAIIDLFYAECPMMLEPQHREYTPAHAAAKTFVLVSRLDDLTQERMKERFDIDYRRKRVRSRGVK